MNELIYVMSLWLIYSFMGFIVETTYVSYGQKKFVYRGFLLGPIIPIYGFGALIVLYLLQPVNSSLILVFIFGVISTSALEYFGSYVMEKMFDLKLWDYSTYPYNLNGRICLKNSILFGVLCVILEFFIHVEVLKFIQSIPIDTFNLIVITLMLITLVDTIISILGAMNITYHLQLISTDRLLDELNGARDKLRFVRERLLKAFPNMSNDKFDNVVETLKKHYKNALKFNRK